MQSADIQTLEQRAELYRDLVAQCAEAIELLPDYPPDGFEFSFLIKGIPLFRMPIPPSEREFALSFFISWRLYYTGLLEDITAKLITLRIKAAV